MSQHQPIASFLDDLASSAATPGGGGAAALAGAMGAALISMVCNLTIGKEKYAEVEGEMKNVLAKSEALRQRLTELMGEDAEAFDKVMAAYRMPKGSDEEKATRSQAIQAGAKEATLVPLAIARACADVIELGQPTAELGNPNAIGDAGVGIICAKAGLKSAALNVFINLRIIKDNIFIGRHQAQIEAILANHEGLADEVYQIVIHKF